MMIEFLLNPLPPRPSLDIPFYHHLLLASFTPSAPCWPASVSFILNSSSHFSFTPVLSPPALPLCLTALCPLSLRPVRHVITSPPRPRHVTVARAALPQNVVMFLLGFFFCFSPSRRSLTQGSQERSDTAPTERPVAPRLLGATVGLKLRAGGLFLCVWW